MRRLDNWLDAYLTFNENSEPPTIYHKWVAVSIVAAVLRRKVHLPWGPLTFYPNFYIVLVGPPGRCRKGTSMKPGYNLLRELGIKMAAESITREALIRELKDASDSNIDPTSGSIDLHSSLTIYSPELTVFLGYNNHQLMSDLTDWFDCGDRWTYRTKNMGTDDISGVFVNLIGATTPDLIQSTLPLDAIGGGLTSRMIFVYADKKSKTVAIPFVSMEVQTIRQHLLHDLEQISMMQGPFRVTKQFTEDWTAWYTNADNHQIFNDGRLAAYEERRPTHILKLCMIMSVMRDKSMQKVITSEDLQNAVALLEETEIQMRQTFGGVGKASNVGVMSKMLTMLGEAKMLTRSQLINAFCHDVTIQGLDEVLNTLEAMRSVRRVYTKTDVEIHFIYKADGSHLQYGFVQNLDVADAEVKDGTN